MNSTNSIPKKIYIDIPIVRRLITEQFLQWADLPIKPVECSGIDNKTFHLGEDMTIRLPSAAEYAPQVEKEQLCLPKLAPHLPLSIPTAVAMGKPSEKYPWHWSIYKWLEGETATLECIDDLNQFAIKLAEFLKALWRCDATDGPTAGPQNFYRGGPIVTYDKETREAINLLNNKKFIQTLTALWEKSLSTTWQDTPV